MKVFTVASCFLAVVAVVHSRTAWDDFLDSLENLDVDQRSGRADGDIDLGNGDFISVQSFNDLLEEDEKEQNVEEKNDEGEEEEEEEVEEETGKIAVRNCLCVRP